MTTLQCHCQNVTLTLAFAPTEITECNCSICRRTGAKWAYYKQKEVQVQAKVPTVAYVWGDKMIEFHHCPQCGCTTHYRSVDMESFDRVAVNASALPAPVLYRLKKRYFDGDDRFESVESWDALYHSS